MYRRASLSEKRLKRISRSGLPMSERRVAMMRYMRK
ncbi:hypothetical protein Mtc_2192 [Methanocella conradii HZ254]|uniref:Uncharacterized protein n=1 Tax=Methanocella conradii (strain DSM 24694 / JCM 17849 / CGMCC 1.5162 / HZ254) TaxID=1041930 RepID=H8I9W7_METCZ|nr:hypothetical protein Mtc_2192 [Methanocella conradii HZ254]